MFSRLCRTLGPRFPITRTITRNMATLPLQEVRSILNASKFRQLEDPIVWVDCEMTGLDVYNDNIIEICCLITDGNLNVVDEEGYESTVFQPKEVLDNMNEWCIKQHNESGLVKKVLDNPQKTTEKVQEELLAYIKKYVPVERRAVMAGNLIHMDKFFMNREFPRVIEHLHYRLIDVSSFLELGKRHNPSLMKVCPKKANAHTARADILESIAQLKWFREHYLKSEEETSEFVNLVQNDNA